MHYENDQLDKLACIHVYIDMELPTNNPQSTNHSIDMYSMILPNWFNNPINYVINAYLIA